jgi:uncharacterized protein YjbJ (UPF0337 family)
MAGMGKQVRGGIEYLKGKIQWMVGKRSGNRSMQAKGAGHQVKGGATYETGKVQKTLNKTANK